MVHYLSPSCTLHLSLSLLLPFLPCLHLSQSSFVPSILLLFLFLILLYLTCVSTFLISINVYPPPPLPFPLTFLLPVNALEQAKAQGCTQNAEDILQTVAEKVHARQKIEKQRKQAREQVLAAYVCSISVVRTHGCMYVHVWVHVSH